MRRTFDPADIETLALGAGVLGTGGGGDPRVGALALRRELSVNGPPSLIDVDDVADSAFVVTVAMGGAPIVGLEKLLSDNFADVSVRRLERYLGRSVDAVVPLEIGGVNSLLPFMVGSRIKVPVIDGDGMGRAFPTLDKTTFSIFGLPASPLATSNEHGDGAIVECAANDRAEQVSRSILVDLGAACSSALFPMSGRDLKRTAVRGTVSLALSVGRAMRDARRAGRRPVDAIVEAVQTYVPGTFAKPLFAGKVIDVERRITGGFNVGRGRLAGIEGFRGDAEFSFQNEYTRFAVDGRLTAVVPDLICLLDTTTGDPVTCETLRYGQRVHVLGLSCAQALRSANGLIACGPGAFGLPDRYVPIEELSS
jgi:hypothetical protein